MDTSTPFLVSESHSDTSHSFWVKLSTTHLAVAEFSNIKCPNSYYTDLDTSKNWVYFNRINVPKKYRRKHVASALMNAVVSWADSEGFSIFNELNPVDISMESLVSFYKSYDFTPIDEGVMIRVV